MLNTLIIGFILFAPFNMGISVGLSVLTYTISSGTDLPAALLAVTAAAPLIPIVLLLGRNAIPRLHFADAAILMLFGMRLISVMLQPWSTVEVMPDLLKEAVGALFYFSGRLFVYRQKQAGFTAGLLLTLLIVFVIYYFSGRYEDLSEEQDRAVLGTGTPVGLSLVFNVLITLAICTVMLLFSKRSSGYKNCNRLWQTGLMGCGVFGAIAAYATTFLIANGTRGAMSGIAVACFLTLTLPSIFARKLHRALALFAAATILMLGFISLDQYVNSGALDPSNRFDNFAQAIAVLLGLLDTPITDFGVEERQILMAGAINLFFQYPVLGCGFNCTEYWVGSYPHNLFLQILAENGIIGAILFTAIIFTSVRGALAALSKRSDPELVILSAIFMSLLTQSMVSFSFNTSRILLFFTGACVSMIWHLQSLNAQRAASPIRSLNPNNMISGFRRGRSRP